MTFNDLCFQALCWTADGELDPVDKFALLSDLIRQATPTEQLEWIQTLEQLSLPQSEGTVQVSGP